MSEIPSSTQEQVPVYHLSVDNAAGILPNSAVNSFIQAPAEFSSAPAEVATGESEMVPDGQPKQEKVAIVSGGLAAKSTTEIDKRWAEIEPLYETQYTSLVRLSALLTRNVQGAEEVVQDAFIALHKRTDIRPDKQLGYLRSSVINRSKSVLRHQVVVDRVNRTGLPALPDQPSAEKSAINSIECSALVTALYGLPPRQREALVLRYYGDMTEAQIASAMGVSRGAVKSHVARGMAALRNIFDNGL